MKQYLLASHYIDWDHPEVLACAKSLGSGLYTKNEIAKRCFEFVRDDIEHSGDIKSIHLTAKASEVLFYKTGFCYSKSHLLVALLRANGIPSGLCYQRLSLDGEKPPFSLHSLTALFLEEHGWYRVDARGNKEGVDAQFTPPNERLAFPIAMEGECDFKAIFAEPWSLVTEFLDQGSPNERLPDCEILTSL